MVPEADASNAPRQSAALSDADIAFLCEIGEFSPVDADADSYRTLERLVSQGFIERAGKTAAPAHYQLTAKAQQLLTERGVGLNEA